MGIHDMLEDMKSKFHRENPFSPKKTGKGISLLEILVGMGIMMLFLVSFSKLQVESNLPMQGMIRDGAMVMNLCERIINSLAADVLAGEPPPPCVDKDVTEAVLEKGGDEHFWKAFVGVGKESTELTVNFKASLTVEDVGAPLPSGQGPSPGAERYYRFKIRCVWGKDSQHSYTLQNMVYRR